MNDIPMCERIASYIVSAIGIVNTIVCLVIAYLLPSETILHYFPWVANLPEFVDDFCVRLIIAGLGMMSILLIIIAILGIVCLCICLQDRKHSKEEKQ